MRVRRLWFDLPSVVIGLIFFVSAAVIFLGKVGDGDLPPLWRFATGCFFVILGLAFSTMSLHAGRKYQRLHEDAAGKL